MKQALSLIGVSFLSVVSSLAADKKPNIILILADDMRASGMNFLGKEQVQTPNLDKLAGESTVFTNAHIMGGTSGAVSMPSRAMLMTGKYLYNLEKQGATIPNSHTMIGETLQKAGYNTFHTGKWHSSYEALNRCFKEGKAIFFGGMWDHWNVPLYDYHADMNYGKRRPVIHNQAKSNKVEYEIGEYMYSGKHSVDIFTHEAVEYIQQQKDKNQPFFLSVAYMSPHDPRSMPDEYMQLYDQSQIQLPPNFMEKHPFDNGELEIRDEILAAIPRRPDEIKKHIREYYAMISHVDKRVGNHSSKNICIPMNKGMLLSVLNRTPITASTEIIRVKILAEEGFDPLREIDVPSLRFGSYNEVNFGRGSQVIRTESSGKDLILTFDGRGSGITPDEFAPKMIGKDKQGKMLFGYASLPYADYTPPLLSSLRPVYRKDKNEVRVEIRNFGLSASGETTIEVKQNGMLMGSRKIKALKPYEKTELAFTPKKGEWTDKAGYQVVFLRDGQVVETNNFTIQ